MSSATIKKIIPCKKDQLIKMVLDIEKYPEFVPWCIEGKIFNKDESSDLITFNGDLKVGKSILNETFSSHVSYHKESNKIIVTNLDGPLKYLKNDGQYVQFQYTPYDYRRLKRYFNKVKLSLTFTNFPPAFLYRCYP